MSDGLRRVDQFFFDEVREFVKWFVSREARSSRLFLAAFVCLYAALAIILAIWDPNLPSYLTGADKKGQSVSAVELFLVWTLGAVPVISLWMALHYKVQYIRLDRDLAVRHSAYYRSRLEREFAEKEIRLLAERAKWERERDEWQARTQNYLYELILDQVERGVLGPRPKSPTDD